MTKTFPGSDALFSIVSTVIVGLLLVPAYARAQQPAATFVAWGYVISSSPIFPPGTATRFKAIASGTFGALVLQEDGSVVAWSNIRDSSYLTPPSGLSGVVAIGSGYLHSLAVKQDGTVVAWGDNTYGQSNVPSDLPGVMAVTGGEDHSLALTQ